MFFPWTSTKATQISNLLKFSNSCPPAFQERISRPFLKVRHFSFLWKFAGEKKKYTYVYGKPRHFRLFHPRSSYGNIFCVVLFDKILYNYHERLMRTMFTVSISIAWPYVVT